MNPSKNKKSEIITFKVDEDLHQALENLPNRSAFIRRSVIAALEHVCPLCRGSGFLSPNQQRHWDEFQTDHPWRHCSHCHEMRLSCRPAESESKN
ncbi:MAG: CopG family transcriptional regulator [Acidobacteria bacterium]|nr:CopG family transcriptional regulator [Acidobacteriota bacterium]